MARGREAVAPAFLDPVLGLVERIDRWVRRVRPVAPGSLLAVERHRHRGKPLTLADGTVVHRGDEAWMIHFNNRRLRELSAAAWPTTGWRVTRDDLRRLAAAHVTVPLAHRPVAYTGVSIVASLSRRVGFEVRDRRRTPGVRLEDWYLRSLMARWVPEGRGRLARGHRPLVTHEVWLSANELIRRYGSPSPPPE